MNLPAASRRRAFVSGFAASAGNGFAGETAAAAGGLDLRVHRGDRVLGRTPRFQSVLMPLGTGSPGQVVSVDIVGTTGHSLIAG